MNKDQQTDALILHLLRVVDYGIHSCMTTEDVMRHALGCTQKEAMGSLRRLSDAGKILWFTTGETCVWIHPESDGCKNPTDLKIGRY